MWTETTRLKYGRGKLRYASDTTDEEWAVIEPLLPPANELGRPRTTSMRAVVDALFFISQSGCQ
jgi:transposase